MMLTLTPIVIFNPFAIGEILNGDVGFLLVMASYRWYFRLVAKS